MYRVGVLSVTRFCYVFPCELRGPAWAVGSCRISQSAGGTSQNTSGIDRKEQTVRSVLMGQSVLFYHYRSDLQNLATDRTLRFVLKAGEVKPAFSACRVAIVWLCSRYSAIFEALESLSWISTPHLHINAYTQL